jgi:hypothetical protein
VENRDFKYVMQDLTNLYIGAKYSYGELMELDEVPFKLKTIFSHYMLREVARETTLENHLFYLTKEDMSYLMYQQMKARFRLHVWQENKGKPGYVSREYRIEEIVDNEQLHELMDITIVEELHITKLGLLNVKL